jgi:hypothetical protein
MLSSDPRKVTSYIGPILISLAGTAIMAFGAYEYTEVERFNTLGIRASGTVESVITREHKSSKGTKTITEATIAFRDQAQETHRIVVKEKLVEGATLQIIYLPSEPESARTEQGNSPWTRAAVPFGFGVLFETVALVILLIMLRRGSDIAWLIKNGERIQTTAIRIERHSSKRKKGGRRRSYNLVCRWRDPRSGQDVELESDTLRHSPDMLLGQTVLAYIDPANPKRYFIDVESGPSAAA